ncbi:MAG: glycosyltransferase family 2 protein [Alphaproteobacteria bacterium]|nr:glycosyltransferase family 2 protein [Alphaproteobacteria bacterium]
MSEPVVSIVIPCYNGGADLPETLASLERQTFKDFEVILVDDGSTDAKTLAYLQSLPRHIRQIRQDNKGLPSARNHGMRAARGTYLLPLDCDDCLEPSFLADGLNALQNHPDVGFVFAQMRLTGDLQGETKKCFNPFAQLFLNQLPYCLLMRKSVWEKAGGYDETFRLGYEDWEFNIRLIAQGQRAAAIDKPLFVYRVRAGGMLNSVSRSRHAQLWRAIQQKHPGLYRLASLMKMKRACDAAPLPYPAIFLLGLLVAHRLLPDAWFNALYAWLLGFSAARRAG